MKTYGGQKFSAASTMKHPQHQVGSAHKKSTLVVKPGKVMVPGNRFTSPTFLERSKQASSTSVQFYKSPVASIPKESVSSLGSVLKSMKRAQSPGIRKQELQDSIRQKVEFAQSLGAKRGKDFVIGFNSINKLLEKHSPDNLGPKAASVVCIASDGLPDLVHALWQVCSVKQVPIVFVRQFADTMKDIFQVKHAFCFALHVEGSTDDSQSAGIDDLREFLVRHSSGR